MDEKPKSALTSEIERIYGTSGPAQKIAAYEKLMNVPENMGVDFEKPSSLDGAAIDDQARAKLTHIGKSLNENITGEQWTATEIKNMPDSKISRVFEKRLYSAAKTANVFGFFMLGAGAIKALKEDRLPDFIGETAIGITYFAAGTAGVQLIAVGVAGAAAFGPVGAAVMVAAPIAGLINLTYDSKDVATFFDWASNAGWAGESFIKVLHAVGLHSQSEADAWIARAKAGPMKVIYPKITSKYTKTPVQGGMTINAAFTAFINEMGIKPAIVQSPTMDVNTYLMTKDQSVSPVEAKTQLLSANSNVIPEINLRFICSSWIYLRNLGRQEWNIDDPKKPVYSSDYIRQGNTKACADFALAAKNYVQKVFDNSKVPVKFNYTAENEPIFAPAYLSSFDNQTSSDEVNSIRSLDLLPAVDVTSSFKTRKANINTCSPFLSAAECGDSQSTVTTNWNSIYFGDAAPIPGKVYGTSVDTCYQDATCDRQSPAGCNGIGMEMCGRVFGSCQVNCSYILFGGNETCWKSSACVNKFGAWPKGGGQGYTSTGFNKCYCQVANWSKYPGWPKSYNVKSMVDPRNWIKQKYPIASGAWTIDIAVTPFSGPAYSTYDNNVDGSSTAITDVNTGLNWTDSGVSSNYLTPNNFFQLFGYMSVVADPAKGSLTLAHMIGHLFGAVHERSSWAGADFYSAGRTNMINREASAYWGSNGKSIMYSDLSGAVNPAFSANISLDGSSTVNGDYQNNNRNQLIRTIMMLTNNQTIERPTIMSLGDPSLSSVVKDIAPVPTGTLQLPAPTVETPASKVTGINANSIEIPISFTGAAPAVEAWCSFDGGTEAPCPALTSFKPPESALPGQHNVKIKVIDVFGNAYVSQTITFTIDPSPALAPIISILLDD